MLISDELCATKDTLIFFLLMVLKIFAKTPGTSTKLPEITVIIVANSTAEIPFICSLSVRSEISVKSSSKGLSKFLISSGILNLSIASKHFG
ncbi:hypothetical protein ES703_78725 [subsurface metagenome]